MSYIPDLSDNSTIAPATTVAPTTTSITAEAQELATKALTLALVKTHGIGLLSSYNTEHEDYRIYNNGIINQYVKAGVKIADAYTQAKAGGYLKTSNLERTRTSFFNFLRGELGISMEGAISKEDRDVINHVFNAAVSRAKTDETKEECRKILAELRKGAK